MLGLPLIRNVKTVDPADKSSPKVVQIETAMGAAVEVFDGARAIEVDRVAFPAGQVDQRPAGAALRRLQPRRRRQRSRSPTGCAEAPYVDLDPDYYKLMRDFDARFPDGPPSLREARVASRSRATGRSSADVVVARGRPRSDADGLAGHASTAGDYGATSLVVR